MADFEDHTGTAADIALEIERKLAVLGIDWHDEAALRQFAVEALQYDGKATIAPLEDGAREKLVYMELCGLIGLMNKTMTESANDGQLVHGSDAWKALAKALWAVKGVGT